MKNFTRLLQIIYILFKYRLFGLKSFKDDSKIGARITSALTELGPIFIKLGQTLSARPDIVGKNIANHLSKLQDRLPPFEFREVEKIIKSEFGKTIPDLYKEFNPIPVAAASIAEVHKAITLDGKEVAVKILRPSIEQAFERDINLFKWLIPKIEKYIPDTKRLKLDKVIDTFEESVKLELDLRFEAAAAGELKENCKNDPGIYIPVVDWQRTAKRVLTIEWVNGTRIEQTEELLKQGHDLKKIAATTAISFFNQAYRDGFFHADLHPGNLLIDSQGQIVYIDFGIMGRIDKQTRIFLAEMIQGFLTRDYLKVAKIHFEAGFVPKSKSLENFAQACRSIGEPIIGQPVNNISIARLLEQLFKITKDFEMETQPQLLLLQKTMVLIEGIGMKLDPDVNMWKLAEPWIENWAIHNISPEAKIRDGIINTFSAIKNKLLHNNEKEVRIVERIIAPQKSYLQVIVISSITTVITYMILKFVLN